MSVRPLFPILAWLLPLASVVRAAPAGIPVPSTIEFGARKESAPKASAPLAVRPYAGEAPPQACRVSFNVNSAGRSCSSILIARNIVVTAAHCFPDDERTITSEIHVRCGYAGIAEQLVFREEFISRGVRSHGDDGFPATDFAFVRLDRDSGYPPMPMPADFDSLKAEFLTQAAATADLTFKPTVECRFSGYGKDPALGRVRFNTSDQSPQKGGKAFVSPQALVIYTFSEGTQLFKGDSGGGYYCRTGPNRPWLLMGILSDLTSSSQQSRLAVTVSDDFRRAWKNALRELAGN